LIEIEIEIEIGIEIAIGIEIEKVLHHTGEQFQGGSTAGSRS
jgi:hypothetical protein